MEVGDGFTGGAPSFFVLAFFTLSLMASMSSFPSVGAVTQEVHRSGTEVSGVITVPLRPQISHLFLPLVVFFIKGFSLGGMKALFRSSCFLVSASACFT